MTRPHRVTARRTRRGGSDGAGLAGLSASAVTERAGERVRPVGIGSGLHRRRWRPGTARVSGRRCLGADVCRNPQPVWVRRGAPSRQKSRGTDGGAGGGLYPSRWKTGAQFSPKNRGYPQHPGCTFVSTGDRQSQPYQGFRRSIPGIPGIPGSILGDGVEPRKSPVPLYLT